MSLFFFTKNEEKVFFSITEVPQSVTAIALAANVPRTSTEKVLRKLSRIGFVVGRKVRGKNKHEYSKVPTQELNDIIETARIALLKKSHVEKLGIKYSEYCGATIYSGREGIMESLVHLLSIRENERIYGLQGADALASWSTYIGEEQIVKLHSIIKENKLILVALRSANLKSEVERRSVKVKESFRGRLSQIHSIPDKFFQEKLSIYVFRDTLLFIDLKTETAIEIINKPVATSILKLISFILTKTERDTL